MVIDNDTMPADLVGISFLGGFAMRRRGSTLVLRAAAKVESSRVTVEN